MLARSMAASAARLAPDRPEAPFFRPRQPRHRTVARARLASRRPCPCASARPDPGSLRPSPAKRGPPPALSGLRSGASSIRGPLAVRVGRSRRLSPFFSEGFFYGPRMQNDPKRSRTLRASAPGFKSGSCESSFTHVSETSGELARLFGPPLAGQKPFDPILAGSSPALGRSWGGRVQNPPPPQRLAGHRPQRPGVFRT